jgi:hypothetical protein
MFFQCWRNTMEAIDSKVMKQWLTEKDMDVTPTENRKLIE